MAAVNLSGATSSPWVYRNSSVGTTWQEIQLPDFARSITITPDAIMRVSFDRAGVVASPESPSDGGVVGTHYQSVSAGASFDFIRVGSLRSGSVFVAAATGTVDVSIVVSA